MVNELIKRLTPAYATIVPLVVAGMVVIAITVTATILLVREPTPELNQHALFPDRDFRRSPFDLMDARDMCRYEVKQNFGDGLLSSHLNQLSTYRDHKRNIFVIVLDIEVGSTNARQSGMVYCNIDPVKYSVVYYRELFPNRGSILTRTLDFFSNLM